ncbi:hypothetical protein SISSUDRAFT_980251 [Sistotremastrum suecicum HHB10207 ss-3]|uniref:Uncharacterized protein n=1 Tax=Sistotremastrum suecicum HHB10207 ss-3 TaxID=1314776 RepID=A0A166HAA4_9AGAM|nr:hypothetical protein SISSUDRAFT_980251 [Sistotremastrum suecicum HHB10207 ss-3]
MSPQFAAGLEERVSSLSSPSPSLPGAAPKQVLPSSPSYGRHSQFIHPNVSRLRSFNPSRSYSNDRSLRSIILSPSSSHHSDISHRSSGIKLDSRPAVESFRWSTLELIGEHFYSSSNKASSVLGLSSPVKPTVLAVNGFICVGTVTGTVLVFDFKQHLIHTCGTGNSVQDRGAVTAVALSQDHTFVGAGHESGHIFLYNLSNPSVPVRTVTPTSIAAVASGRKEGHLNDARISSIGFVGARHTAIISSDENGLAFYHRLGKVLFVEATDVVRILGKYPAPDPTSRSPHQRRTAGERRGNTILASSSLPLGTVDHSTDKYSLVALLTPVKLLIVGLQPTPKTWYRCHRDFDGTKEKSRWRGVLSWFPSVESEQIVETDSKAGSKKQDGTLPLLVYAWGKHCKIVTVAEVMVPTVVVNDQTGAAKTVPVGKIVVREVAHWSTDDDVLSIHWINATLVLCLTASSICVWEARSGTLVEQTPFRVSSLISAPAFSLAETKQDLNHWEDVSHSVRVHKGKIFVLGHDQIRVGTLLSWADRILSFVREGDFLSAMDLARAYLLGTASGSKHGLPDDPEDMKAIVGTKLRELMIASTNYAFSEDRLTDQTHVTPDGRGVDRTSLFEGMVTTCAQACIALNDFEFLFENLYERYLSTGIQSIFLTQIEPLILDNSIPFIPPRITKELISMHDEHQDLESVEKIIWHIDPQCLDIDQAVTLCSRYHLWDALLYVYSMGLLDYISPLVELLGLVRQVRQLRISASGDPNSDKLEIADSLVPNANKIFTYLSNVLSGLTYPQMLPMPADEAIRAKKEVYNFLFFGRSNSWPRGGKLVLTSEVEGGPEPTYPYVRLLLNFDTEAFLHTMDIAFEDSFLNDRSQNISRLVIVKILLEILSSSDLDSGDQTLINIFIARNVPKYPQFMDLISPTALQSILIHLAEDEDDSTREDRQLAAEYLLSVYTPHQSDHILSLFRDAKFFRILRTWFRQEHKWAELIGAYLGDTELENDEMFTNIDTTLRSTKISSSSVLPEDIKRTVTDALPQLLDLGIQETAFLLDRHLPQAHEDVVRTYLATEPYQQFVYLRCLAEPELASETTGARRTKPAPLSEALAQTYTTLACRYDRAGVLRVLRTFTAAHHDPEALEAVCELEGVYEGAVWSLSTRGRNEMAFTKAEEAARTFGQKLREQLLTHSVSSEFETTVQSLRALNTTCVQLCMDNSRTNLRSFDMTVEEMWFKTLRSQIDLVHILSPTSAKSDDADNSGILTILHQAVQDTFTTMMSLGTPRPFSLPRLFKRLVDSSARYAGGSSYAEFRAIFTGMLESFHFEGELLSMTRKLIGRDTFIFVDEAAKARQRGWKPVERLCPACKKSTQLLDSVQHDHTSGGQINQDGSGPATVILARSGHFYHSGCLPEAMRIAS